MELYLKDRGYSLSNVIRYNISPCEVLLLQWLIEDSMATLLTQSVNDTKLATVLPNDFTCNVPTTMHVGQRVAISPTFVPQNTTDKQITCVSSDSNVVQVVRSNKYFELVAHTEGTISLTITSIADTTISHTYAVEVIPAPVSQANRIYFGVIPSELNITAFEDVTEAIAKQYLKVVSTGTLSKVEVEVRAGDLLTVIVPRSKLATKDNGVGGKVQFMSSAINSQTGKPIQSNGDVQIIIDGSQYYIYGEFIINSVGSNFIYVD